MTRTEKRLKQLAYAIFALCLAFGMLPIVTPKAAADEPELQAGGTDALAAASEAPVTGIVPGSTLDGVKVRFRPAGSHKPVSVEDNGDGSQEDLLLYYLGESTHFRLERADDDSYKIRFYSDFADQDVKRKGAQVLDVERNDNDNSTYYREDQNIHMVSGDGDALNKRWRLIRQEDGTYYIQNKLSGLYWSLEDLDSPRENNNEIVQRKTPMKWEIELVSTSGYSVSSMKEIKGYDSLNFDFGGQTVTSLNWMSFLPDGMYVSDLSIPGVHDAATASVDTSDKESRRTQQYYIDELLNSGVRHLDTRLGWEHNTLTLVHSTDTDTLNHQGNDLTLDEVLGWIEEFLAENSSETVIIQVNADEKADKVIPAAMAKFRAMAQQDDSIIWVGDHVPTLGEARGHIIIISRFEEKYNPSDFYIEGKGYWGLDVGGWRQSDTYPFGNDKGSIHSTAQPSGTKNKWNNCEVWVQDSYSHTPDGTLFKNSKKPYIVGGLDGIVYRYFGFSSSDGVYPEGTYGAAYRRNQALENGKQAWVFNYTNCSANGLGYHYRGNAKVLHQWIYDNDWIVRDDMYTGVLANDYADELLSSKVYRTNFAGGSGGWSETEYKWELGNSGTSVTCTATRSWRGGIGYTETETTTATLHAHEATCLTAASADYEARFHNEAFGVQVNSIKGAAPLGHDWGDPVVTAVTTCDASGTISTYTCGRCGLEKTVYEGGTGSHAWDDATYAWSEDKSQVTATHKCTREGCQAMETETTATTAETVPATCDAPGQTTYSAEFESPHFHVDPISVPLPQLSHRWGAWTTIEERTCTENGKRERTCALCDDSEEEVLVAQGHSPSEIFIENEEAATCTAAGLHDEAVYCLACDTELSRETVQEEALGHDWGPWVETSPATTTQEGQEQRACNRCNEVETRVIPIVDPEKPTYRDVEGNGASWQKGSSEPLSLTFKRSFSDGLTFGLFTGIEVDGTAVPEAGASGAANYAVEAGSLVLKLQPAFLETLAAGEHELKVLFEDGSATATFVVEAASSKPEEGTTPSDEGPAAENPSSDKPAAEEASGQGTSSGGSGAESAASKGTSGTSPAKGSGAKASTVSTGDALPVVALVAAAALGAAMAVLALRKRKS